MNTQHLNTKEISKGARWAQKHAKLAHSELNNRYVRFALIPIPTEIALAYHIKCDQRGLEEDITDYGSW